MGYVVLVRSRVYGPNELQGVELWKVCDDVYSSLYIAIGCNPIALTTQ